MSKGTPKTDQKVEDGETAVRTCAGVILANPAYHCRPIDLWPTELNEAQPDWIASLERYLRDFARPIRTIADEIRCLACDRQVTGHHAGLADWRFKEALTYDPDPKGLMEGRCSGCGYPVRLKHEIRTDDGTKCIVRLIGFPLFFHPESTSRTN